MLPDVSRPVSFARSSNLILTPMEVAVCVVVSLQPKVVAVPCSQFRRRPVASLHVFSCANSHAPFDRLGRKPWLPHEVADASWCCRARRPAAQIPAAVVPVSMEEIHHRLV